MTRGRYLTETYDQEDTRDGDRGEDRAPLTKTITAGVAMAHDEIELVAGS